MTYQLWWPWRFWRGTVRMVPRRLLWRWQRSGRGWADCDTWGTDMYLAGVIGGMLRRMLKENCCDYPLAYQDDLLKIIHGMEAVGERDRFASMRDEEDHRLKTMQDGALDLLKKHFGSLWD